jgi:hypothetical protein
MHPLTAHYYRKDEWFSSGQGAPFVEWFSTMKNKSLISCCLIAGLLSAGAPAFGSEEPSAVAVAADVVLARPFCFAATIVGSVFFLISLPVAAISHSVNRTAHVLVGKPAEATFTRPLGEFDTMTSYSY